MLTSAEAGGRPIPLLERIVPAARTRETALRAAVRADLNRRAVLGGETSLVPAAAGFEPTCVERATIHKTFHNL